MSMYTKFNNSSCNGSQDLIVYARKKGTNRPKNLKKSKQKKRKFFAAQNLSSILVYLSFFLVYLFQYTYFVLI